MANYCQLYLTCFDKAEATKISDSLLEKKLITCAKQIETQSQFNWRGAMDYKENEVILCMDSREDLFEEIEKEVSKLHSYQTFVLQAIPVSKTSQKAAKWLKDELK